MQERQHPLTPCSPPGVPPPFGINTTANRSSKAGFTLIETAVSLMVVVIGLAGLFATSARCFTLLRRSKEVVAAREDLLCRLDSIRMLSYPQVAKSSYISGTLLSNGSTGDATPYGMTTQGMSNFTETITVYALGWQLFSSDGDRNNTTPDTTPAVAQPGFQIPLDLYGKGYGSQMDSVAPAAPKTYKANTTTKGDWTLQVAGALPYFQVKRVGTGASAVTTVLQSNDLTGYPQFRVDVQYSWTDSNNKTRTQLGSTIVARSGSLP